MNWTDDDTNAIWAALALMTLCGVGMVVGIMLLFFTGLLT
jgi:hypothetical protein